MLTTSSAATPMYCRAPPPTTARSQRSGKPYTTRSPWNSPSSTTPARRREASAEVGCFISHASQRISNESHDIERMDNQSKQLSEGLSIPIVRSENDPLMILKLKLEKEGIYFHSIIPGQYHRMSCPKCGGGESKLRSFSLFVREDLELAMWQCFSEQCQWRGHMKESMGHIQNGSPTKKASNIKVYRLNRKWIRLEPLGGELLSYVHGRGISANTLERNGVMQRRFRNEIVIAFPYWQNKSLVSCKYRSKIKRFSKEKDTKTIFYGIDDVKEAAEIVIVEGEMDKLSMEEAGYCNCISVPHGAHRKASKKILTEDEDTSFRYLYSCKASLEQASRIILATDSDPPGQLLAEELAARLGLERCWRVSWPRKDVGQLYKDANEVLVSLGPEALRSLVEYAEPWLPSGSEASDVSLLESPEMHLEYSPSSQAGN